MLPPSAGLLLNPIDASVTDGTQPDGAPAHVSRTKIFWTVPGISVSPSEEASTNTAYRLSWLSSGNDSEPGAEVPTSLAAARVATICAGEATGVKTVKERALDVPPPGVGVTTVTWSVPVLEISLAGIIA